MCVPAEKYRRDVKRKIATWIVYSLLFAVVLGIFVLRNVDGETVREKLEGYTREKTGMDISISTLELSLPFSATMLDVKINDKPTKTEIRLEKLEVGVVLWKLLFLSPTMRFKAVEKNGFIAADVSPGIFPGKVKIKIESRKFPVDKAITMVNGMPLPVQAALDADIEAGIPLKSLPDIYVEGGIALTGLNLKTDSTWGAMMKGFLLKSAKCSIHVRERALATNECVVSTSMGDAQLRLTAKLSEPVANSALDGSVMLTPSGKLADMAAMLYAKYRKPDGAYYLPLAGTLGNPALAR